MEILGKLFGSTNKVKIMRLFLLNPEAVFSSAEVSTRSRISSSTISRELNSLAAIEFLNKKTKDKAKVWQLNPGFPFINHLKGILKNDLVARKKELLRQFAGCGRISLLIISGIFIEDNDSRADLLIVGENLKKKAIERVIKGLEAEIGKELAYAVLDTSDFRYRLNACDKFVRDVLDYPHERLVDKLNLPVSH
jgi:hypothetical protein